MTVTKPEKLDRTYVILMDADDRKSKSATVHATREDIIALLAGSFTVTQRNRVVRPSSRRQRQTA